VVEAGIRKLKENIGALSLFLKSRGIPLTLVVYPYPFHVVEGKADRATQKIWSGWSAETGVDFVDLFPEFVGLGPGAKSVETYYLEGDCHWNAAGHARVAEALLQRNREKILPSSVEAMERSDRPVSVPGKN
jgi:lysophospholipase L1-like esterase